MRHELTVLKFGGSVLRDHADLSTACDEVARWRSAGSRVLVVVSAFEGTTDRLLREARAISPTPPAEAASLLLATGEFQSAALLTLALQAGRLRARVLHPGAISLRSRGVGMDADPASVDIPVLRSALADAGVVIVPGFIATDAEGSFVTLGRGGSDLTALFLAAELRADRCRLIKDVDGLYERDPALPGPPPRRFASLSWDRALDLDGGIVQHKAVRFARARLLTFEVGGFGALSPTRVGDLPCVLGHAARKEGSLVA